MNRHRIWLALPALALLMALAVPAMAIAPVPSGSISPFVWDLEDDKWVNGNPKGWMEGETAAMAVDIVDEAGHTYFVDFCLQAFESPFTDAYGFTAFEPWDTTFLPPTLPGGLATPGYGDTAWDLGHAFINSNSRDPIDRGNVQRAGVLNSHQFFLVHRLKGHRLQYGLFENN